MYLLATSAVLLMTAVASAQIVVQATAKPKAATKEATPLDPAKEDAKWLNEVKLSPDDIDGLIAYLKSRTLSESDLGKIQSVIRRMGDESFEERLKASAEAITFGSAAIGPLRTAATTDPDPEIQFRALETLRTIEKVSHAAVATAVAHTLAKSKHAEAAAVLLGFLPMADNATVDDEIRAALRTMALQGGKLEAALVKGLRDPNAVRRAASAVALIEATLEAKSHREEVAALVVPMLKNETDNDAKFRVSFILATTGKNPDAIQALVEVLPTLGVTRGRVWQVEDVLLQLAGDRAPKIKLGSDKAALERGRDEWLNWLKVNVKAEHYALFDFKPRTNGRLLMMWSDNNWGGGRIVELGPDLRVRWRISGVMAPADFAMLPNGDVEVLEHNYSRLRVFDTKGTQKSTRQMQDGQPLSIQRFNNGNILVAYRQAVIEYDKDWKKLNTYARANQDILSASRLGNGPVWVLVQSGPGQIIKLDDKFKELPKPIKAGNPHYQAKLELLPNDRAIVTDQNQVIEVDLKNDKTIWSYRAQTPFCTHRLPSGNTLICDTGSRTVKEIDPDGKEVLWTYTPPDGLQPMRAYRQ